MQLTETRVPKYVDLKDTPTNTISNVLMHISNSKVLVAHYDINDQYLSTSEKPISEIVARWQGTPLTSILDNRKKEGRIIEGRLEEFEANDQKIDLEKWKST